MDCFVSGPVRLTRDVEGACELRALLNSSTPKAALATLLVLAPYSDETGVHRTVWHLWRAGGQIRVRPHCGRSRSCTAQQSKGGGVC